MKVSIFYLSNLSLEFWTKVFVAWNLGVDKIVGYAVSYHLKNNEVETSKDGKLVLTSER
jgi:hypothetical protein